MTINERLIRMDIEDKIYLGELVQSLLQGEGGALLIMLMNGIEEQLVLESIAKPSISSDKVLGGIQALKKLRNNMDMFIIDKENLLADKKDDASMTKKEKLDEVTTLPE